LNLEWIGKSKARKLLPEYIVVKLLLIGDTGVGKSCLVLRFADNTFTESFISTLGVDFKMRTLDIGGTTVKIQLHDVDLERYRKIFHGDYGYPIDGVVLVYDVTNQETFANVPKWLQEFNDLIRGRNHLLHQVLVGNKCDMVNNRKVTRKEAEEFASQWNLEFFETSAKNATNVEEAFIQMANTIKEKKTYNPVLH